MRSSQTPPLASRTYYPQNRSMLFILGCVNGLAATLISSTAVSRIQRGVALELGNFSFLIPLTISLLLFASALSTKLVVAPDALIFHHLGVRAHTPWPNLVGIGPRPGGAQSLVLLHLRAPAVIDWVWISAGYRDRIQAFPLIGYAYQPGTALRADLERHAPQLRGADVER